jgi:hypothetical protein
MEGKPLPDYSQTDDYQVDLCLRARIVDEAFYIFLKEIQFNRKDIHKRIQANRFADSGRMF